MAEDELADSCLEGDLCGFGGGAVEGLPGEKGMFGGEGGFVVEAGDAADKSGEFWTIDGVGAVGVGTDGVGWCGEACVGNDGAVVGGPVHSCLDVVDL